MGHRAPGALSRRTRGTWFRFSGDIDLATAPEFVRTAAEAVSAGGPPLTVDLTAVPFMDVAGARALMTVRCLAVQQGQTEHPVRVCGVNAEVRRVLELLGVSELFPGADG